MKANNKNYHTVKSQEEEYFAVEEVKKE